MGRGAIDAEHTFILPSALAEGVPSQEDLKRVAEASFAGECVEELVDVSKGVSNQRRRLLGFLAGELGIEDPTKDPLVKLAVFLHESRSGKVVLIPECARALVCELIELAVKDGNAERESGTTADFGHRSRRYLRRGFDSALNAVLDELDESVSKASGRPQARPQIRPEGKFILADKDGRGLSMDILQMAVGDSLPDGVTLEQLYEALHESAVRRVADVPVAEEPRGLLAGLRAKLRELFGATSE